MTHITNKLAETAYVCVNTPAQWRRGRYLRRGERVEVIRTIDENTIVVRVHGGVARVHPSMLETT
jgi:hypothetical protein